jgi:hypothetical protein
MTARAGSEGTTVLVCDARPRSYDAHPIKAVTLSEAKGLGVIQT